MTKRNRITSTGRKRDAGEGLLPAQPAPRVSPVPPRTTTAQSERRGDAPKGNLTPSADVEGAVETVESAQATRPLIGHEG